MKISLNPTYFCNFRCSFCYLTDSQLASPLTLNNARLRDLLHEIAQVEPIHSVDIYGGEVTLMSVDAWYSMKAVIREFYQGDINVITNLSRSPAWLQDEDITMSVSYDFSCRQAHQSVFTNMLMFPRQFSVLMLASECLVQQDVDHMIHTLNMLSNCESVEIKPYSSNQANQHGVTFHQFEQFVKQWIVSSVPKQFAFMNELLIQDSLAGAAHSFSDDHIYITPQGTLAVLEFDAADNEFFLPLDNMQQYAAWAHAERARVSVNDFCGSCKYLGNCLSEHLRDVRDLTHSCNGFKLLLDWYDERVEAAPGDLSSLAPGSRGSA